MSNFEQAVIQRLKSSGLSREHLSELASAAAQINTAGLKASRILTKGIPVPDWVRVSGVADRASLAKIFESAIDKTKGLGGVHVFPYGIPKPDLFHVEIDIGPGAPMGH